MTLATLKMTSARGVRTSREQGSVIVLVVVTLVLMALLGAVYLQTTRVQRFAISTNEGDIDAVEQAVLAMIFAQLGEDLTGGSTGSIELYDYPWTNTNSGYANNTFTTERFFAGSGTAVGGADDDMWLASNEAAGLAGTPYWPHITNMSGHYLRNATGNGEEWDLTQVDNPSASSQLEENLVNHGGNIENTNTNIPFSETMLVDTDGDDIGDARWMWAPIPQINGMMYPVAIRIVDLSARVNLNTSLGLGTASGTYATSGTWTYDHTGTGGDAPFWSNTSEIDFGRLAWRLGAGSGEISSFLSARLGVALGANVTLVPGTTRDNYWTNTGRFFPGGGTPTSGTLMTSASTYELLYRNGVSSDGSTYPTDLDPMSTFLRKSAGEADYTTFDSGTTVPSVPTNEEDFFYYEPRKHLTAHSGAAIFGPRLPSESGLTDPPLRVGLNTATDAAIETVISSVFSASTPTDFPGASASAAAFAEQFTANIADYADADNNVTLVGSSYGLEALPFLSNVYVQRPYDMTASSDADNDGVWDVTWSQKGNPGFAIEINNPFNRPILLTGVSLYINNVLIADLGVQANIAASLSDVDANGDGTNDGKGLAKGQTLILYQDSTGGATASNDTVSSLFEGTNEVSVDLTPLAISWPTSVGTTTTPINVELRATLQGGGTTDDYSLIIAESMPESVDSTVASGVGVDPLLPSAPEGYRQLGFLGNSNDLLALSVDETDVVSIPGTPGPTVATPYDSTVATWAIGVVDKTSAGGPAGDSGISATGDQILIADDPGDNIHQVGELAHIANLGFSATQRVGTVWKAAGAGNTDKFRLNFNSTEKVGSGNRDVAHAVFLMDRFTTYTPGSEDIVPGLINFNTASYTVLSEALPIPNTTLRNAVATAIINYRDNPTGRNGGTNPGIAYLGELFTTSAIPAATNTPSTNATDDYALVDDVSGVKTDFLNSSGLDMATAANRDGIADDREESAMIARWLSQVGSVRSDYFAAYVLLYEMDWNQTTPIDRVNDSRQFVVIFRRNAVSGAVDVQAVYDSGSGDVYRY